MKFMESIKYSRLYVSESENHPSPRTTSRFIFSRASLHSIFHIVLIASNFNFLGSGRRANTASNNAFDRNWYSEAPAKEAIRYEKRRLMRDIQNNVFTGHPRLEHDDAWRKLIEPMTIKISHEELGKINETSIEFKDGSGVISETAVYHELHCIKRIRRHLNLDYYYPNMTDDERRREGPHIDHCLEYWREAAMCRGDTTLSTFRWADGIPYSTVYSDHECVNWERLDAWARGRMVDMTDLSVLIPES